jgi:hypothetical protein
MIIDHFLVERRIYSLDGSQAKVKIQFMIQGHGCVKECYPRTKQELIQCIEKEISDEMFKGVGI